MRSTRDWRRGSGRSAVERTADLATLVAAEKKPDARAPTGLSEAVKASRALGDRPRASGMQRPRCQLSTCGWMARCERHLPRTDGRPTERAELS